MFIQPYSLRSVRFASARDEIQCNYFSFFPLRSKRDDHAPQVCPRSNAKKHLFFARKIFLSEEIDGPTKCTVLFEFSLATKEATQVQSSCVT